MITIDASTTVFTQAAIDQRIRAVYAVLATIGLEDPPAYLDTAIRKVVLGEIPLGAVLFALQGPLPSKEDYGLG